MVFRWVPVSIIQITTLWWQLWNWTACWMTPGRIGVIGLCRYMHKSHSACLCPLHVISLTQAIKDHLYGQITNLNPVRSLHSESRARRGRPVHYAQGITVPTLTGLRGLPFAAMQRREELKDFFYPSRHDHSSLLLNGQHSVEGTGVDRWPLHSGSLLSPAGFSWVWNT